MKIKAQKGSSLNEAERLEMARLLVKAGYTVRIVKEKDGNKTVSYAIEYSESESPV